MLRRCFVDLICFCGVRFGLMLDVSALQILFYIALHFDTQTDRDSSLFISSVQFKMVSMRSEKPTCAPPGLSDVSPTSPLKRFRCSSD